MFGLRDLGVGDGRRAGTRAELEWIGIGNARLLCKAADHNNFLSQPPPTPLPLRPCNTLLPLFKLGPRLRDSRAWFPTIEPAHHPCGAFRRLCLKLSTLSALLPAQCLPFLLPL